MLTSEKTKRLIFFLRMFGIFANFSIFSRHFLFTFCTVESSGLFSELLKNLFSEICHICLIFFFQIYISHHCLKRKKNCLEFFKTPISSVWPTTSHPRGGNLIFLFKISIPLFICSRFRRGKLPMPGWWELRNPAFSWKPALESAARAAHHRACPVARSPGICCKEWGAGWGSPVDDSPCVLPSVPSPTS